MQRPKCENWEEPKLNPNTPPTSWQSIDFSEAEFVDSIYNIYSMGTPCPVSSLSLGDFIGFYAPIDVGK